MLYVHMSSKKVRDMNWDREDNDHCAGAFCPKIVITMKKQFEYTPCFTVTDEQVIPSNKRDFWISELNTQTHEQTKIFIQVKNMFVLKYIVTV